MSGVADRAVKDRSGKRSPKESAGGGARKGTRSRTISAPTHLAFSIH